MIELINIFLKWFKVILVLTIVAGVGAALISLTKPNEFRSKVVIIPSNTSMLDRNTFYQEEGRERTLYLFGNRHDIDRLTSLAASVRMKRYLVEKFDLYNHYGIDPNHPEAFVKVSQALGGKFNVTKDDRGIMEIEVFDTNPEFAATMANDITKKMDEMNRELIFEKQKDIAGTIEQNFNAKKKEVSTLKDSLLRSIKRNPTDTVTAHIMFDIIEGKVDELNQLSKHNEQYKTILSKNFSTFYVIEEAEPALQKFRPKRSIIVLSTMVGAFLLLLFLAVIIEKYRELKDQFRAA